MKQQKYSLPHSPLHDLVAVAMLQPQAKALHAWNTITPLARNELVSWLSSVPQPEHKARGTSRTVEELASGKRRPCCWAGCSRHKDLLHEIQHNLKYFSSAVCITYEHNQEGAPVS